jgi:hypothetical protein
MKKCTGAMQHVCQYTISPSISPISRMSDHKDELRRKHNWVKMQGTPNQSVRGPFVDYYNSESPGQKRSAPGKENFAPPVATAPPLDSEDDDLAAFAKCRTHARDAMIQVEGIPKLYILVDFAKWGTPMYREALNKRNELEVKMKRKMKQVSFSEVNQVFPVSPIMMKGNTIWQHEAGLHTTAAQAELSQSAIDSCPKQAFGLRCKPALYTLDKTQQMFWA